MGNESDFDDDIADEKNYDELGEALYDKGSLVSDGIRDYELLRERYDARDQDNKWAKLAGKLTGADDAVENYKKRLEKESIKPYEEKKDEVDTKTKPEGESGEKSGEDGEKKDGGESGEGKFYKDEYLTPEAVADGGLVNDAVAEKDKENDKNDKFAEPEYDSDTSAQPASDEDASSYDDPSAPYTASGAGDKDYSVTDPGDTEDKNDPTKDSEEQGDEKPAAGGEGGEKKEGETGGEGGEKAEGEAGEGGEGGEKKGLLGRAGDYGKDALKGAATGALRNMVVGDGSGGKQRGSSEEFGIEFIKKYYKRLRNNILTQKHFDQLNLQAGSSITGMCSGFDYLILFFKPKYANPLYKLDVIVEIAVLDDGLLGALFDPLRGVLNFILTLPLIKQLALPIVLAAKTIGSDTMTKISSTATSVTDFKNVAKEQGVLKTLGDKALNPITGKYDKKAAYSQQGKRYDNAVKGIEQSENKKLDKQSQKAAGKDGKVSQEQLDQNKAQAKAKADGARDSGWEASRAKNNPYAKGAVKQATDAVTEPVKEKIPGTAEAEQKNIKDDKDEAKAELDDKKAEKQKETTEQKFGGDG